MTQLTDKVRTLFDGRNFAVLSTPEPDGKPHATVVWVIRDGDDIVLALPKSRRKAANLTRDPRAAVVILDAASPYESAQVQGTASLEPWTPPTAAAHSGPHRGRAGTAAGTATPPAPSS